jgi:hypothetical protein
MESRNRKLFLKKKRPTNWPSVFSIELSLYLLISESLRHKQLQQLPLWLRSWLGVGARF